MGPTQNYDDEKLGRWKPHPTLAVVVRVLVSALPPLVSIGFGLAAARWLPPERLGLNRWLWLVGEVACAWGLLWVSRKLARRLLPLSTLLSLGLFFPDQVPSRFRMALRAHSTKALQDRIEQRQVQGAQLRGEEQYATTLLDLIAELRAHDRLTRGHSERVQAYASMIGKELRLSEEDTAKLRWAALLHDVGKLHVPGAILNKTSRPTDREWAVLATHPQHGIELAQPLREWLGPWLDAIGQHHEKWNGTGYPAGLSGNAISYGARIVAVADTYDVITSARSYKKPMTAAAARAELARCAGTQFDPMVVRAFLAIGIGRLRLTAGPLSALASMPGLPSAPLSNLANLGSAAGGVVAVTLATAVVGLTPAAPPATPAAHEYLALAAGTVADPQSRATRRPSPHASSPAPGRHSPSPTSIPASLPTQVGPPASGSDATTETTQPATADPTTPATTEPTTSTSTAPTPAGPTTTAARTTAPRTTAPRTTAPTAPAPRSTATTTTAPPTAATTTAAAQTDCAKAQAGATYLPWANLKGCDLRGRHLTGYYAGAKLTGADLTGATLNGINLAGATLTDAKLRNATVTSSVFDFALMRGIDLRGTTFSRSTLRSASLTNATLVGTGLEGADLSSADLSGAHAVSTRFTWARVSKTAFAHTDLTGATFRNATGTPSSVTGATWSSTTCTNGKVRSTSCY